MAGAGNILISARVRGRDVLSRCPITLGKGDEVRSNQAAVTETNDGHQLRPTPSTDSKMLWGQDGCPDAHRLTGSLACLSEEQREVKVPAYSDE